MSEEAIKRDLTKPQLSLVSTIFITAVAKVMTAAVKAGKYPKDNWRKGLPWSVAYDSLQRHLTAWWGGEELDPESGLPHTWHASCNLMFLIEYQFTKVGKDDRYQNILSTTQKTTDKIV